MEQLWYYLSSPQAIIYAVATALLYPVLVIEVGALVWVMVDLGRFTAEAIVRRRSLPALETAASKVREAIAGAKRAEAVLALREMKQRRYYLDRFVSLLDGETIGTPHMYKLLEDIEFEADRRLRASRLLVRIGPALGLMGTLIPISPALVALASGDVQTLSDNLVIAFSTTVVGLLIGGVAHGVVLAREHMYAQDMSDMEYLAEIMEVQT